MPLRLFDPKIAYSGLRVIRARLGQTCYSLGREVGSILEER